MDVPESKTDQPGREKIPSERHPAAPDAGATSSTKGNNASFISPLERLQSALEKADDVVADSKVFLRKLKYDQYRRTHKINASLEKADQLDDSAQLRDVQVEEAASSTTASASASTSASARASASASAIPPRQVPANDWPYAEMQYLINDIARRLVSWLSAAGQEEGSDIFTALAMLQQAYAALGAKDPDKVRDMMMACCDFVQARWLQ